MTTETFGRPESPAYYSGGAQQQGVHSNSKSAWALGLGVVARGGEQMGSTAIVLGVIGFAVAVVWVVVAGTVL